MAVNFMLGGTATKWDDYRRPAGDMPEAVTIPAGASSTVLTVVAVDDNEVEWDETIVLTIATDPTTILVHPPPRPSPSLTTTNRHPRSQP